jgi:hypothetical protein
MMDPSGGFELVRLKGGAVSIRSLAHGETMHIGTDPRTESMALHINQQRLVERAMAGAGNDSQPFIIWDVGMGPACNAIMAMESLRSVSRKVEIHSFEISTEVLEFALRHAASVEYLIGWESHIATLLQYGTAYPGPHITWLLHRGDFSRELHHAPSPASIFHDPYSPPRNPGMWNIETFSSEWHAVSAPRAEDCLLTNYTRSTAVRVSMALAGWFVGRGVATGCKSETTIASNRLELLEQPLGRSWLDRVKSSSNASPLRGPSYDPQPITGKDLLELSGLSQFS